MEMELALRAFARYLSVQRGSSPATIDAYSREVRSYLTSGVGLRAWLGEGSAPSTTIRRLAAIRVYCRFAGIEDVTRNIDRPRRPAGLPRPVEDPQDALRRLGITEALVAMFLLETGLRISEALAIDTGWPAPTQLLIRGKGGRERIVVLTDKAQGALGALGGKIPLSKRTIQRRFRDAGFTPHQLRHTLGTELAASGADLGEIQDILGHASPSTTRVYARYSTDRLRRAQERRHAERGEDNAGQEE